MIGYIRELALELWEDSRFDDMDLRLFRAVVDELKQLRAIDFSPDQRADFVKLRVELTKCAEYTSWSRQNFLDGGSLLKELAGLVESYGVGHHENRRSFSFVSDAGLRQIIERDYQELAVILLPSGAWKSTVVMAGSILEAILIDRLTRDAATMNLTLAATKCPKGKDIRSGEWTLHHLIEVADELKFLPPQRTNSIDQCLRDYRNYVHPKKEIRTGHPCTEAEALMAKGALDAVCNHFI